MSLPTLPMSTATQPQESVGKDIQIQADVKH
jgi:hypothetical protein